MIFRSLLTPFLFFLVHTVSGQGEPENWTALAVPWYPDELKASSSNFSNATENPHARRLAMPAKLSLGGIDVTTPNPIAAAVCDETTRNLLVVERDTSKLRFLDLANGKFLPDSIQLKETPSRIHVSGPWRILIHDSSGRLELHHASNPDHSPSWTVPAGEDLVAVGIAANQPAAPFLVLSRTARPAGPYRIGSAFRLHCLNPATLKPTKWKVRNTDAFADACAGLEFVKAGSGTFLFPVDDDGRTAHLGTHDLIFKSGFLIEVAATKCPQVTAHEAPNFPKLHHGRWIKSGGRGDIRGPEGSDLLPDKLLERLLLSSSPELLIASSMEPIPRKLGETDRYQPILALWDSKLLTPLATISGIGPDEGESSESTFNAQGLPKRMFLHSPDAAKIVIISRTRDRIQILDTPIDQIRKAIPHRNQTAVYPIPPSGVLTIPLDTEGLETCTWEIVEAPDGAMLDGSTLVWRKPPNMKFSHRSLRFALDAVFPSGMRTRIDLVGTPPREE